jgi:hypothetical protein
MNSLERLRRSPRVDLWRKPAIVVVIALLGLGVGSGPALARPKRVSLVVLATQSVFPGETARYPFLMHTVGRVGSMRFTLAGVPDGVQGEILSAGSGRFELSLRVGVEVAPRYATVTVKVHSLAAMQSVSVYLEIKLPTVTVDLECSAVTMIELDVGQTVSVALDFGSAVQRDSVPSFGLRGLPPDVAVKFADPGSNSAAFTLIVLPSAAPGEYSLTVVEFGATFSRSYRIDLRILEIVGVLPFRSTPDSLCDASGGPLDGAEV